jgi:hypothetical protein
MEGEVSLSLIVPHIVSEIDIAGVERTVPGVKKVSADIVSLSGRVAHAG